MTVKFSKISHQAEAFFGAIETAAASLGLDISKDQIEQTYRQKDDEYANQLNQIEQGKAQAISQAVQGVASVASKLPV